MRKGGKRTSPIDVVWGFRNQGRKGEEREKERARLFREKKGLPVPNA